jgi:hypothetical protein
VNAGRWMPWAVVLAAAFRPWRRFPWIPVRGVFTMSNLEFVVLRRRLEVAK